MPYALLRLWPEAKEPAQVFDDAGRLNEYSHRDLSRFARDESPHIVNELRADQFVCSTLSLFQLFVVHLI